MPLAAYAVIYCKPLLIYRLKKVNLDIISLKNQTLLMYTVENEHARYISSIMSNVKDPGLMDKLMNHRDDDDDVPLTHYPFHPKQYGKFRYCKGEGSSYSASFISMVSRWGADMYALIKNDPSTFLPYLLAYRSDRSLKLVLPYYTSMSLSRVLYYATLPIDEKSEDLIYTYSEGERLSYLEQIKIDQKECIAIVLKDLVFRRVFRPPVPEQQVKLMDELIASDEYFRNTVDDFKINFIEKEFQNHFIEFGDNRMTLYDFFKLVFDDKKLKFLAQQENLLSAWNRVVRQAYISRFEFYRIYQEPIQLIIKDAKERLGLLENLKKISSLREAIPLPFEVVLDIVEYLNNNQLNAFIRAFYSL